MPINQHGLDDVHAQTLNAVLASAAKTREMIEKAKAAGLDMSAAEQQNETHCAVAQGLKKQFFPHIP